MASTKIALGLPGTPDVREMMRIARRAEDLGYESVWVTETRFTRDGITCAAAVAAATERVRRMGDARRVPDAADRLDHPLRRENFITRW